MVIIRGVVAICRILLAVFGPMVRGIAELFRGK